MDVITSTKRSPREWILWRVVLIGDGKNTDAQSMDYPNGLPNWTILKWTTPENNNLNERYLMFVADNIIKLLITSANVHSVQPLASSLNSCN